MKFLVTICVLVVMVSCSILEPLPNVTVAAYELENPPPPTRPVREVSSVVTPPPPELIAPLSISLPEARSSYQGSLYIGLPYNSIGYDGFGLRSFYGYPHYGYFGYNAPFRYRLGYTPFRTYGRWWGGYDFYPYASNWIDPYYFSFYGVYPFYHSPYVRTRSNAVVRSRYKNNNSSTSSQKNSNRTSRSRYNRGYVKPSQKSTYTQQNNSQTQQRSRSNDNFRSNSEITRRGSSSSSSGKGRVVRRRR